MWMVGDANRGAILLLFIASSWFYRVIGAATVSDDRGGFCHSENFAYLCSNVVRRMVKFYFDLHPKGCFFLALLLLFCCWPKKGKPPTYYHSAV